jgi:thiamine-monophosphate kinase
MSETVSDMGEFGLINRIHGLIEKEGVLARGIKIGIGDDSASFQPPKGYELLVTCDSMVEGRHYLPKYISPLALGRRAMVSNLSDIGAMGGTPLYALVSLGLKESALVTDVEALYRGFLAELRSFGASIIGGNLTKSEDNTFIDITLIGKVKEGKCLRRSTAKPGDVIMVTGFPGQASAGLQCLLHGESTVDPEKHPLVKAYLEPSHRAREGKAIAESGFATAMIDTSDGFLGDLGHICEKSSVGASIVAEKLPVSEDLRQAALEAGRTPYDLVLQDSDDYELIITCSSSHVDQIRHFLTTISDVAVTEVGRITEPASGINLILPNDTKRDITNAGWDHFRRREGKNV